MSAEIKNTIGLLCKLINLLYKTNLKPEYFRLAKFNKTSENVVPILWNLLIRMLDEDNFIIIKRKLHDLNYKREKFYSCTETNCESRELLIAISYLLSLYLENVVNEEVKTSVFSDSYEPFKNHPQFLHNMTKGQFDWQKFGEHDLENYKKWIYGKTSSNKNAIIEYKEHIFKLQEKFNNILDIKANGKLTIHEILALKNKTIGEQFILDTEPIFNILNVYTEWIKKEKYFWKWMESVLLEEKKELSPDI